MPQGASVGEGGDREEGRPSPLSQQALTQAPSHKFLDSAQAFAKGEAHIHTACDYPDALHWARCNNHGVRPCLSPAINIL